MALGENTSPAISKGESSGQIIVDTTKEHAKTSLKIILTVGVQEVTNEFSGLEVYDCQNFIQLPKLKKTYRYQINQKTLNIFGKFKSDSEDCVISTYSLNKKINQVSISSMSGTVKMGNQKKIPETNL